MSKSIYHNIYGIRTMVLRTCYHHTHTHTLTYYTSHISRISHCHITIQRSHTRYAKAQHGLESISSNIENVFMFNRK